MAFNHCNKSIRREDILNNVSEYDVLSRYMGINSLPVLINSPFRNDRNASMSIFSTNNGHVLFKDFGNGDRGDVFDLVGHIYNMSFTEVLDMIANDMSKSDGNGFSLNNKRHTRIHKSSSTIDVKTRQWSDYDMDYWNSYGISKEWLGFGDVHPISHIIITRDHKTNVIVADRLAYVYVERKDSKVSLKIYQPKSQRMKWLSKNDSSVWDLWTKIPKGGDTLFITSSRKDALCLWANTGIPSVSMQGEGYIPKPKIIDELKFRFKRVIVFFDNDFSSDENHGHIYASKLCDIFGLQMVEIPSEYKSKDPSDLYRNVGKTIFRKVIRKLIDNLKTSAI